jgi:hypothetical protein
VVFRSQRFAVGDRTVQQKGVAFAYISGRACRSIRNDGLELPGSKRNEKAEIDPAS